MRLAAVVEAVLIDQSVYIAQTGIGKLEDAGNNEIEEGGGRTKDDNPTARRTYLEAHVQSIAQRIPFEPQ